MTERRIRHCLSSANSTMAGIKCSESLSKPITFVTWSNLEIMFKRTSGTSSLSNCKKMDNKCWLVPSFPKTGASNSTSDAKAERT